MPNPAIPSRLAVARKDLLDLSCRNRLISTPRGAARSSRLEIVDELSDEVFRRLVADQKSMSFVPVKQAAEPQTSDDEEKHSLFLEQPTESESDNGPAARHTDDKLQTTLASEKLQRALLKFFYDARTHEEEQGVNILYLAMGYLKWFEDEKSTKERFAPLILLPVSLSRRTAAAKFRVTWTQDDIITNISLQEKLWHDFGIKLPELPSSDELVPTEYCKRVAEVISSKARWEILPNDMVLWFFSFAKFLMYRDLDPEVWPEERPLGSHELIDSVLGDGFREEPPICGPNDNIDKCLNPAETIHVVDADSSQAVAIAEARNGRNLVIQGPPGTGKSQTITNIIASAVRDGKKVLFVAEKMAALEVVKRRLSNIGLGDMCLELHSHKANKRAVLEDLKRTLGLRDRPPKLDRVGAQVKRLIGCRDELNRHAEEFHTPIGKTGISAFQAVGTLVRLTSMNVQAARFTCSECVNWENSDFERKLQAVEDLAAHVERMGKPSEHPWRGVTARGILPSDVANLTNRLPDARQAIAVLQTCASQLSKQLSSKLPLTAFELAELARAAQRITTAPPMDGTSIVNPVWTDRRKDIDHLIEQGTRFSTSKKKLAGIIRDDAWHSDVEWVRRDLDAYGRSWLRFLNGKYWAASAAWPRILVGKPPRSLRERLELLDDFNAAQKAEQALAAGDNLGRAAFGRQWQGLESDWDALGKISKWEHECCAVQLISGFFRQIASSNESRSALIETINLLAQNLKPLFQLLSQLVAPLKLDLQRRFGKASFETTNLEEIDSCISDWIAEPEALATWTAYLVRCERLVNEGLKDLAQLVDRGEIAPEEVSHQFKFAFFETILREAFRTFPELEAFNGVSHQQVMTKFKELDLERIKLARQEVAHAHHEGMPNAAAGGSGELGVIQREINKQRGHLPIRKLLRDAGHAAQAIKPVFMMSPISVAQFLEPGILEFDVMLIDEASQVQPVDALGAIARAKRIVVVGDDRQLPPTQFFSRILGDDEADEDEENPQTSNIESILGLCRSKGIPDRMLRWHYRSRHHSLIAVSNHEFYDDKLFVVPSPENQSRELGLKFHLVQDGVFDRGRSRTNRNEAAKVARAVIDHARTFPTKSLGVGAFSVAQRDAILDELEILRRQHEELESFFATGGAEPFFVKNLENIQGDERDVIFISVGYAKDASGFMNMGFGPLSWDGGERRLNVLISRAKERCEVFSSITADAIDLNRSRSHGVKALKTFFQYAKTGELDVAVHTERECDSDFECEVAKALESLGYVVHSQVGLAGFFIDLAVVDPNNSATYLLGLECDGAAYHSSRSARDRDRLRQQVLEDRGWRIHRIWSTDWFRQPKEQLRQVVAAIEDAKAACSKPEKVAPPAVEQIVTPAEIERDCENKTAASSSEPQSLSVPYRVASFRVNAGMPIHELPAAELARIAARVVEAEGPVHVDEVTRRIATLWGCKRTGSRIADAVKLALSAATKSRLIKKNGKFFQPVEQSSTPIRDRSNVDSTGLLKPEYLPPDEIRAAAMELIRANFGMNEEEIVCEVARLLGFRRTGPQVRQVIGDQIRAMVSEGLLVSRNEKLYCVTADAQPGQSLNAS